VIVTVPVRAYLNRLAAAKSPVSVFVSLVDPDGVVRGSASRLHADEVTSAASLPVEVAQAIPTLGTEFSRVGGWFALRLPVEGTRVTAVIAVPLDEIVAGTAAASGCSRSSWPPCSRSGCSRGLCAAT
jgi:hypothetical protein